MVTLKYEVKPVNSGEEKAYKTSDTLPGTGLATSEYGKMSFCPSAPVNTINTFYFTSAITVISFYLYLSDLEDQKEIT